MGIEQWIDTDDVKKRGIIVKSYNDELYFSLSRSSDIYKQIQIQLLVTNMSKATLLIYCPFDETFIEIFVYRNNHYLHDVIEKLSEKYYKVILPFLHKKYKKYM